MPLATVPPGDYANGFGIALGMIAFIVLVIVVCLGLTDKKPWIFNPFGPFVRWFQMWWEHRLKMNEWKVRYKMRKGDPDFVDYLEKVTHDRD